MKPSPRPRTQSPRVLLLDLFGTVVHFAPRVPTVEVAGTPWRSTMHWLRDAVERDLPDVDFDNTLAALMAVSEEIVHQRPPEYYEVPSRERFRRAITRLGIDAGRALPLAERLAAAHMTHLAAQTIVPPSHPALLERLASRYRLGMISNFDHAPTARRILNTHRVAAFFDPILISDEFGRRKPHPAIFEAALQVIGASPEEALFVGDSIADDVIGAHNAHLPVAWLNVNHESLPPDVPPPDHIIGRLDELPDVLEVRS
jgi:HAD superfamily hydrolase (TIGR01549 family)